MTTTNSFLPPNYETPKQAGNYYKSEDGENIIRILTSPLIGWVDFDENKKPHRFRLDAKPFAPMTAKGKIKFFWIMVIWNEKYNKLQVMEATQVSVIEAIEKLSKDTKYWGDPRAYNIKIEKEGEGLDTKYAVFPLPKTPIPDEAKAAYKEANVNLDVLFSGGDPFASGAQKEQPKPKETVGASPSDKSFLSDPLEPLEPLPF